MTHTKRVFVDANVVIGWGRRSEPFGPLKELADAELIQVLTTDLTVDEIAKRRASQDYEHVKLLAQLGREPVRRLAQELQLRLPEFDRRTIRAMQEELLKRRQFEVKSELRELKAAELHVDDIKPSQVFSAYAKGTGFFESTVKRRQFADAFVFERLRMAAEGGDPIVLWTQDKDFVEPVGREPSMRSVNSIEALYGQVGRPIKTSVVIDAFFTSNETQDVIMEEVQREADDRWLMGDVEDAEIEETTVRSYELTELRCFEVPGSLGWSVSARLDVDAEVRYTHPDWETAMWDSEDKVLLPFRDVSGTSRVVFGVDVAMRVRADDAGNPIGVENFRFTTDDILIEL